MPRCPQCKSTDLWQDNFWEGCNKCTYLYNAEKALMNGTLPIVPISKSSDNSEDE